MKIIRILVFLMGVMMWINVIFLLPLMNFNTGILLESLMGLLFVCWAVLHPQIKAWKKSTWFSWCYRCLFGSFVIYLLTIAVIGFYGMNDTVTYEEDALIVLGAALRGDVPNVPLMYRLDAAYDYALRNPKVLIVVSGGQGPGETIPEGVAMATYLMNKGLPKERLIIESASTSTFENFTFSKELLDGRFQKPYTVAFISNQFHLLRAGLMAQKMGYTPNRLGADIQWYNLPMVHMREALALYKWLLIQS